MSDAKTQRALVEEAVNAASNFLREAYGARIRATVIISIDDGASTGDYYTAASNTDCIICHTRPYIEALEAKGMHGMEHTTPVARPN